MKVRVVFYEKAWDMRKKHALREGVRARRLKRGQCLVAFNKARTMARVIDCEGGVHDYYADVGEEYDMGVLREQFARGLDVELDVGRHESVTGVANLRAA